MTQIVQENKVGIVVGLILRLSVVVLSLAGMSGLLHPSVAVSTTSDTQNQGVLDRVESPYSEPKHDTPLMQGASPTGRYVLNTTFPQAPAAVPHYKIKTIEEKTDRVGGGKPLPTNAILLEGDAAARAAEKALQKYGGLPSYAKLQLVEPVYGTTIHRSTNEIIAKEPICTDVFYGQMLNGSLVIGAKLTMELDEKGNIVFLVKKWPIYYPLKGESVRIISAKDAYVKFTKGEITVKYEGLDPFNTEIKAIELGYQIIGGPETYLDPVGIFSVRYPFDETNAPMQKFSVSAAA
jgi:hypothetical protein